MVPKFPCITRMNIDVEEALSDDARLTYVCQSVCLSVAYRA